MPKLCFVTRGQHLELQDRILIERRCGAAIDSIAVWHAINEEHRVPTSLAENGCCSVCAGINLSLECDTRHQLQQVKIVAPVDRHLFNLLWQNRSSRGRARGIDHRQVGGDDDRGFYGTYFKRDIEGQNSINSYG